MEETKDEVKVKKLDKKKALIIGGSILLLLLSIYIGLSIYFQYHFYFRTSLYGENVSGYSIKKIKDESKSNFDTYELTLIERNNQSETIKGSDIALEMDWGDSLEKLLKKQTGFAWPAHLFFHQELDSKKLMNYDRHILIKMIDDLSCMQEANQVAAVNAGISEYDEENGFALIPAIPGTIVDKVSLLNAIETAIYHLDQEMVLEDNQCYLPPEIDDDNETLLKTLSTLQSACDSVITYQVGEDTFTLDSKTFGKWLYADENGNPAVNPEEVATYVATLASTYNTCYNQETLMTSYGVEITIPNSHYGWKVDEEAEKNAVISDILAGTTTTRDLNYSMYANSHSGVDYGNSYVEINLTAQHLFLYENGVMIYETDIVTGKMDGVHYTPPGVFGITYCQKNATLRGPGYATPVSYWMPFNGDIGLHDATWNAWFGASRYKRNGSHGCVNLPLSAAAFIYQHVSAGFPVLVYELPGTESEAAYDNDQADNVTALIRAIGDEITLESEGAIYAARTAYDALTERGKGYVTNYQKLIDAETALNALKGL